MARCLHIATAVDLFSQSHTQPQSTEFVVMRLVG